MWGSPSTASAAIARQTDGTPAGGAASMSSGFGFKGREGRCYRFWKDVEECSRNTEVAGQCTQQVEDYVECLHHKKELSRMNAVLAQKEKNEAAARHGGHAGDGHGH